MEGKRLLVWSLKGGQGKTTLSTQISLLTGSYIMTNDIISPVDRVLEAKKVLKLTSSQKMPELPSNINLIYDFGGYPDQRLIWIFKHIDYCIIPIAIESNDDIFEKQGLLDSVNEVSKYTKNIIVVINKAENRVKETVVSIRNLLIKHFPNEDKNHSFFPIFEVKRSNAFSQSIRKKMSIRELCSNPLLKYHFKEPLNQMNELINFISK